MNKTIKWKDNILFIEDNKTIELLEGRKGIIAHLYPSSKIYSLNDVTVNQAKEEINELLKSNLFIQILKSIT